MSKSETANEGEAGAKKGGKKLVLIIVGLVLLLGLGGGGAWFFLHKKGDHAEKTAKKPKPSAPPIFVTLEPFVVNLAGEASHYLQVGIDLKVADGKVGDAIKAHLPEIRNGVLLLLSSKQVDELGTLEGKNRLRDDIRNAVNRPLGITPPKRKKSASEDEHAEGEKAAGDEAADGEKGDAEDSHESDSHADAEPESEGVQDVLLTSFVIQ